MVSFGCTTAHGRLLIPALGLVWKRYCSGGQALWERQLARPSAWLQGMVADTSTHHLTASGSHHSRSRPITRLPASSTAWGLTYCGREIAVKLANHHFSGCDCCAPVDGCANISLRGDSGLRRAENGLGEWLTTAIHDAKPLNASPGRAAATVRPSQDPAPAPAKAASLRLPEAWRSSTWGPPGPAGQRPPPTIRHGNSFRRRA